LKLFSNPFRKLISLLSLLVLYVLEQVLVPVPVVTYWEPWDTEKTRLVRDSSVTSWCIDSFKRLSPWHGGHF
jgi:hypothetical protein